MICQYRQADGEKDREIVRQCCGAWLRNSIWDEAGSCAVSAARADKNYQGERGFVAYRERPGTGLMLHWRFLKNEMKTTKINFWVSKKERGCVRSAVTIYTVYSINWTYQDGREGNSLHWSGIQRILYNNELADSNEWWRLGPWSADSGIL